MSGLKDVAHGAGAPVTQASRQSESILQNTSGGHKIAVLIIGFDRETTDVGSANVYMILSGVSNYADGAGQEAVTYLVDQMEAPLVDYCRQRDLRGVVLFGAEYDSPSFLELAASDITLVAIDIPLEGPQNGCVLVDNRLYARQAVQRLIQSGCRNIAMLAGSSHAHVSLERMYGYRAALEEAGLSAPEAWTVNADFDTDRAYRATLELLRASPEIDAFFCASDYMAIGCHHALLDSGRRIPDDCAVFGFDGTVAAQMVYPTLATVRQDGFGKGYAAAALLTAMLAGEDTPHTITLPCQWIEGDSIRKTARP